MSKRDLAKKLARLEKRRPCGACLDPEGLDGGQEFGTWVARPGETVELLLPYPEGSPAPNPPGPCRRCGRTPSYLIVREIVVTKPTLISHTRAGLRRRPTTITSKPRLKKRKPR